MSFAFIRGHTIWAAGLNEHSIVIDAGAHRGEFSAEIIRRFGCRCHLIEANPQLARLLDVPGAQSIIPAALDARDGTAPFHIYENLESGTLIASEKQPTSSHRVNTISLRTVFQRINATDVDLIKLDIEGAEFELLRELDDSLLARIGQITVEFHDFVARFANQGLFERARDRLEGVGFMCCVMSFRTNGDTLFLNRRQLQLGWATSLYASHLARYIEKARVLFQRRLVEGPRSSLVDDEV
jgi:FkbM family methyltransferase